MKARGVLVKNYSERGRASHVNTGTAIPRDELPVLDGESRVFRWPKVISEVAEDEGWTALGGLGLVGDFLRLFRVPQLIDRAVEVLKFHNPYHESDHVLAQALNLYVGGTRIEDVGKLQGSAAIKTLVGAPRIPDPTTAGDFLRRFQDSQNPGSLESLRGTVDQIHEDVWDELERRESQLQRKARRLHELRKKRPGSKKRSVDNEESKAMVVVDLDGHIKEVYGNQKEGADFSHTGKWSYQVLTVSIAGTGETLALRLRPGCDRSSEAAPEVMRDLLPRLLKRYSRVLVRADSDFDRADLLDIFRSHKGVYFAIVGRENKGRPEAAEAIPESQWEEFIPRAKRLRRANQQAEGFKPRKKKENLRDKRANEREYKDLRQIQQWMTEIPLARTYPDGTSREERLVIRRQHVEMHQAQKLLWEQYRYHYVVTDLPDSYSTQEVIDETYRRCDQENVIEQFGSGIAAWTLPVAEFEGNAAWLEIARLAWNLAKWIALLALPEEVVRWEWKRFRHAFVYVTAKIYKRSRQVFIRYTRSDRFVQTLIQARTQLQT